MSLLFISQEEWKKTKRKTTIKVTTSIKMMVFYLQNGAFLFDITACSCNMSLLTPALQSHFRKDGNMVTSSATVKGVEAILEQGGFDAKQAKSFIEASELMFNQVATKSDLTALDGRFASLESHVNVVQANLINEVRQLGRDMDAKIHDALVASIRWTIGLSLGGVVALTVGILSVARFLFVGA